MEAPPSPLIPMPGASPQEEEEEISFFLASLATATTTTSCSSSSRTKKVTLSLLPASPDFMAFQGFVSLGPHQLPLAFSCETPGGRVLISSLRGDARLRALWEQGGWLSRTRLERCGDVASFSAELEDMLSTPPSSFRPPALPRALPDGRPDGRETKRSSSRSCTVPPSQYRQLLRELDALGWDCIHDISPSPSSRGPGGGEEGWMTLSICVLDAGGRKHEMMVDLPPHQSFSSPPTTLPRCRVALPPIGKEGGGKGGEGTGLLEFRPPPSSTSASSSSSSSPSSSLFHLQAAKRQFEESLRACQDFWDVMDDFDTYSWVMGGETERFRRHSTKRRLVLHAHASCVVTIDVSAPYKACDIQFIGPEATIRPWSERMYTHVGDWDTSKKPRENLEAILGISFPTPPAAATAAKRGGEQEGWQQEYVEECCICYAYRLEDEEGKEGGETPTLPCENERCRRLFHPLCLRQWLQTLPDTKVLGGHMAASHTLVGACPFCSDPISLPVPASSMA